MATRAGPPRRLDDITLCLATAFLPVRRYSPDGSEVRRVEIGTRLLVVVYHATDPRLDVWEELYQPSPLPEYDDVAGRPLWLLLFTLRHSEAERGRNLFSIHPLMLLAALPEGALDPEDETGPWTRVPWLPEQSLRYLGRRYPKEFHEVWRDAHHSLPNVARATEPDPAPAHIPHGDRRR